MFERILVGEGGAPGYISFPDLPRGRFVANDLEPLYSVTDGELALPDHAAALPEDSLYVKVPRQREVMVSSLSDPLHVAPRALCSCFFSLPCCT